MAAWLRRWWWPITKTLLATAIVVWVGRQFYRDLQDLDVADVELRPAWLVVSGALYLAGMSFSALFWHHLLKLFGQEPTPLATARAYFIALLGKYVPGKAVALLMRGALIRGPKVRLGVALLTAFYEVLTSMAAGALLAAVIFIIEPPAVPGLDWHPVLTGLLLLVVLGVPLMPVVFNFLAGRLVARFQTGDPLQLPALGAATLLRGLVVTGCGWLMHGLALWALLQAVLPEPPALAVDVLARYSGAVALAYVSGFLVLVAPGGLGVREYFLLHLLRPDGPGPLIAVAVLLLRLVVTAAELLAAAALYWLPHEPPGLSRRSGFIRRSPNGE